MRVGYGKGQTKYGPGVSINMEGWEVSAAIDAWLVAHGVHTRGPRTIMINGQLCREGHVYVDPCGFVSYDGGCLSGSGPKKSDTFECRTGSNQNKPHPGG